MGIAISCRGVLEAGEKASRLRMSAFLDSGLARYGAMRNIPSGRTTSRLSQDLRFGLISIRELHRATLDKMETLDAAGRDSAATYVSELVWREFYMQVLWNFPGVLEEEFNAKYRGMVWPGKRENFQRWCDGQTGFPIVDAAMRELRETGFMHNRTRMIAAMFLTKDLHLDWRMGKCGSCKLWRTGRSPAITGVAVECWHWSRCGPVFSNSKPMEPIQAL